MGEHQDWMVERVARAIDPDIWSMFGGFVSLKGYSPAEVVEEMDASPTIQESLNRARAAMRAMKNPTLAMRKVCTFEEAEVTWPAMIDAALSPTQSEPEK